KEGAPVILEGTPFSPPGSQGDANIRFLLTDKLTFNGKEYGGLSPAFRKPDSGSRPLSPPGSAPSRRFM
ncbi:MAG: hypothetical protein LBP43_04050, partial [Treponema sp.]|nr:hypothetical protein [Treponema sp.]